MPQISTVRYSDVREAERFDAEYFKPEFLNIFGNAQNVSFSKLSSLAKVSDGDHAKFPENQKPEIRYLRAKDIKSNFLVNDDPVYVSEGYFLKQKRSHVNELNILMSIMGSVGDITITPEGFKTCLANRAICIISNIKTNPYFLYAYLTTKIADKNIQRIKKGGVQERINLELLNEVLVPNLSELFQLKIENIVRGAHEKQAESKKLYEETEALLLEELRLTGYVPEHMLTYETTKKAVDEAGRFDAEYFQPKYAEIIKKIEHYRGGFDMVRNQFKLINGRTPEYYSEDETEVQVLKTKQIRNEALQYNGVAYTEKRFVEDIVRERDVLFASMGVGSLGRTGIFYGFETNKQTGADSTIRILRRKKITEPEVLQVFFNSVIGQRYIYRYVVGSTGIISIKNSFISNLKIPLINPEIQKQIAEKVQRSHILHKESKDMLEDAKRLVEEEIEKG